MPKTISHNNIFYVRDISKIGGVETFVYEMAKKYKYLDIAVCFKSGNVQQLERIEQYCPTYKIMPGDMIQCKICIINYDTSILDQICPDAKIYMVFHADYSASCYKTFPIFDKRIHGYISITKHIQEKMQEIFRY